MKNLLLLPAILFTTVLLSQPLQGNYTINPAGGDFQSFTAAVTALENRGVSGAVIISAAAGTYIEQVSISSIPGASPSNTITFNGQTDSSAVIVSFTNTSARNYILQLNGAKFIRFNRITFRTTSTTTTSRVVSLINEASDNIFTSNQFIGRRGSGTSANASVVYSLGEGMDNNVFLRNRIMNGIYGVYYRGTTGYYARGTVFSENYLEDAYYRGIEIQWQTAPVVSGNRLHTSYNYSPYRAFNLRSFDSVSIITNNHITGGRTEALILYSLDAKGSTGAIVANNFVQITDGAGISTSASDTILIAYNSINITGDAPSSAAINLGTGSEIRVFNNNCVNNAGGYAVRVSSNTKGLQINYNNYYSTGQFVGRFLSADAEMLANWQQISGRDENSMSLDPDYVSETDLHLQNTALNGAGTPLAEVTTDIDGDFRNNFPDIGADEIDIRDLELQAILSPVNDCNQNSAQNISILVANAGGSTIPQGSAVNFFYSLNNGQEETTSHTFSNDFNPGDSLQITFSSPISINTGKYILTARHNYEQDANAANDTLKKEFHIQNPVNNYPYLQGFETGNEGWYSDGVWERKLPTGTKLDTAANGVNAWVSAKAKSVAGNTTSYLYSPCYDLTTLSGQTTLSFKLAAHLHNSDSLFVEYSEDGENWQLLGRNATGTNWYNQSGFWNGSFNWRGVSQQIPLAQMSNKSQVRFRFVLSLNDNTSAEGAAIDDVHIYESTPIFTGAAATGISANVSGSGWVKLISSGNVVAEINPQGQNLGAVTLSVYSADDDVRSFNNQLYLNRNWVLQSANNFSSPIKVRLFFTADEFDALVNRSANVRSPVHLGFTKYSGINEDNTLTNNSGSGYVFKPARDVEIIPYAQGYYAEFEVTGLSEFYANGGGETGLDALPVELVNFSAVRQNRDLVILEWATASEQNNAGFEIQRSGLEEENWQNIGFVAGAGNSTNMIRYRFDDLNPVAGQVCYRLRQVDYNGDFEFSRTTCVEGTDDVWRIRWAAGLNEIFVPVPTAERAIVYLIDMNGKIVRQREIARPEVISTQNLPAGVYTVRLITASGKSYQDKLVVYR